jgi:hypothetical protein
MMVETGSDQATIRARYGDRLDRHIAAVSTTPGWRDDAGAATIPEKVRTRITCHPIAVNRYAQNGICSFAIQCNNDISRTRHVVREFNVPVNDPGPTVLCTIDPGFVIHDELEIEGEDPSIRTLNLWEEILKSVSSTGRMPQEPFVVGFRHDSEIYDPAVLYVIERNGDLSWWKNREAFVTGGSNVWEGPRTVGNGWNGFQTVFNGGGATMYAVRRDGNIAWYNHKGFWEGRYEWLDPPRVVGHGFQSFKSIFPGGEYVIYAIQPNGDLLWFRHDGGRRGGGVDTWRGGQRIGNGWQNFTKVMSGGKGIIYGITLEGALVRYNHSGYLEGTNQWGLHGTIGRTGWSQFRDVVAAAHNVLYAFTHDGRVLWYKYKTRVRRPLTGGREIGATWEGPVEVRRFLPGFHSAFILLEAPVDDPG